MFDSAPLIFIKCFALPSEFMIALLFWVSSQSHRQNFQASNLSVLLLETGKPRRFLASSPSHLLPQRPDFHSSLLSCSNRGQLFCCLTTSQWTNVRQGCLCSAFFLNPSGSPLLVSSFMHGKVYFKPLLLHEDCLCCLVD